MRLLLGLFCILFLVFSAGPLAQQPSQPSTCGFTVQSSSTKAEVTGPPDLVPLVYVVDQPDSPIEIQSVNLDGSWLAVTGDRYSERTCVKYHVRNRSDGTVQHVTVYLGYYGSGGGAGTSNSVPIPAGQAAELVGCGSGGTGDARTNPMRVLISVGPIAFDDCFFHPSARVPVSLGIKPSWLW